ncbi:polyprenyl synthetase family protein [Acidocella sp. MX-AZ03]|uniref:polyprenyl synthetase family protein n=1 Tax=Acidocella sp. MX-AZ03 TaxID=2697363 RepID=UPI003FA405A4
MNMALAPIAESDVLAEALAGISHVVEGQLDALLPVPESVEARLVEAMRYAVLNGGKRIRALLVVEVANLFSADRICAARVAASVEMLHAYSLVHDDLPAMDDDDLRRGQPSCHKKFDEATAILAGNALLTRAFEVLVEADTDADTDVRCELVLALAAASGMCGMVGGQMIDIESEGKALSVSEIMRLQALKTGRLIQYAAEAGAILGRANASQRLAIANYGRDLGTAFRIYDDILDVNSDTATLGKTAGKDAAQGKATTVSILGLEQAKAEAKHFSGKAISHLESFGDRAEILRALVRFTITRRS